MSKCGYDWKWRHAAIFPERVEHAAFLGWAWKKWVIDNTHIHPSNITLQNSANVLKEVLQPQNISDSDRSYPFQARNDQH